MIRSRLFLLVFVPFLAVVGCTHLPDPFLQIYPGMDKTEVSAILGTPEDRSFSNEEEHWTYSRMNYLHGTETVKIITFKNNKVVSLKNDQIAEQRSHELARAQAGATQIKVSNHSGYGYSQISPIHTRLQCTQSNTFGRFPVGGGCNAFGCWPAGGECTTFGCSANAHCGISECPGRIETIHCD